ncbi:hypothetical protein [Mycoplasmopsis cynos]|uniref:hypothetical protein n=1 Tax=Mycoplasmopsis cynos TaxID=171284 RepID=UPI0021FB06A5|nr:hypothetical protein [Mycoplasmopsis cynos]UWV81288.1 hypothetical protein NW065_04965 [Mycoplasmopsis cynos]
MSKFSFWLEAKSLNPVILSLSKNNWNELTFCSDLRSIIKVLAPFEGSLWLVAHLVLKSPSTAFDPLNSVPFSKSFCSVDLPNAIFAPFSVPSFVVGLVETSANTIG